MIKLVSKEGHEFSVEKQAAMVSNTIKSMLTGPGMFTENESDTINFPEISKEVLEEVRPRASVSAPPSAAIRRRSYVMQLSRRSKPAARLSPGDQILLLQAALRE